MHSFFWSRVTMPLCNLQFTFAYEVYIRCLYVCFFFCIHSFHCRFFYFADLQFNMMIKTKLDCYSGFTGCLFSDIWLSSLAFFVKIILNFYDYNGIWYFFEQQNKKWCHQYIVLVTLDKIAWIRALSRGFIFWAGCHLYILLIAFKIILSPSCLSNALFWRFSLAHRKTLSRLEK